MTDVRTSPSGPLLAIEGGGPPLSNVFYLDKGGAAGGDGSIGAPFNTAADAFTAIDGSGLSNVVLMVTPYDYSDEGDLVIGFGGNIAIQGLESSGTNAFMPTFATLTFQNAVVVTIDSVSWNDGSSKGPSVTVGELVLRDCEPDLCEAPQGPLNAYSTRFGGGGISCASINARDCLFSPSSTCFVTGASATCRLTRCAAISGPFPITFTDTPGIVKLDDYSVYDTTGANNFSSNGTIQCPGLLPVGSITGVTEQNQIDSIVTALVNLGLVVDNR